MCFPSHRPCAECGASVTVGAESSHVCDERRRLEFQLAALQPATASLDDDLRDFMATREGRFEAWLARREVRRTA